jgi:transcriptional regulator with XRE-family HTH domain
MASATPFSENLRLVLKLLSMSAAGLASELAVDKSVVSRWLNGSVQPSAHNLSRLSALVAGRVDGFRALDWERTPDSLAEIFGADPRAISSLRRPPPPNGLSFAIWDQMVSTTALRGRAYEGFFRSTRPHPRDPDGYLYEWGMIRRDEIGLLRLTMGSAEAKVAGWLIPLQDLVYIVATAVNSGAMMFGIFNGVGASRVDVFDGLILVPANDMGRSPLATAMLCERVGDLSGDAEADDRRFDELSSQTPIAPAGSVPDAVRAHLVRDFGPAQLDKGGDWLLTLSLLRSMARGPYDERRPPPVKS